MVSTSIIQHKMCTFVTILLSHKSMFIIKTHWMLFLVLVPSQSSFERNIFVEKVWKSFWNKIRARSIFMAVQVSLDLGLATISQNADFILLVVVVVVDRLLIWRLEHRFQTSNSLHFWSMVALHSCLLLLLYRQLEHTTYSMIFSRSSGERH